MLNSAFKYIVDILFVNKFIRYTQLNDQSLLFLTIQIKSFARTDFKCQTALFDPEKGSS